MSPIFSGNGFPSLIASACTTGKYKSEKLFFKSLLQQLQSVAKFFEEQEKALTARASVLHTRAKNLLEKRAGLAYVAEGHTAEIIVVGQQQEAEASTVLGLVVGFHKELLMLENYAVLNFCGLSKILKKHDKSTGFVTREKFMMNMVIRQVKHDVPFDRDTLRSGLIGLSAFDVPPRSHSCIIKG